MVLSASRYWKSSSRNRPPSGLLLSFCPSQRPSLSRVSSMERQVALKILQDKLKDDPEFVANFNHEALNAAKINHPNIVQVYAAGTVDGACYFAMEYIEGETMKQVLNL
mgnify:CR=1 FL=1